MVAHNTPIPLFVGVRLSSIPVLTAHQPAQAL